MLLTLTFLVGFRFNIDIQFEYAVEGYVMANSEYLSLGEDIDKRIAVLGNQCFKCREIRTNKFLKDPQCLRYMFWAVKNPDKEISQRALKVIRKIAVCNFCKGTGYCRRYVPGDKYVVIYSQKEIVCKVCNKNEYTHWDKGRIDCPLCDYGLAVYFEGLLNENYQQD